MASTSSEVDLIIFSTAIKALLFPSYRSTDFEVHRNWLAITHSLPLSKWYYDDTSPWTLDYPPFFAYFEYVLSHLAIVVDPEIVRLDNLQYQSSSCIIFQRASVIITELVLLFALLKLVADSHNSFNKLAIPSSLFLHPAILIVDHIHFQYNGFLLGILLWSIWAAKQKRFGLSAFLFASLLNFKHIFIYLAPPFLVYLFRAHCTSQSKQSIIPQISFINFFQLAAIVLATCLASFGPFLFLSGVDGIIQIFSRLFPFQRGLNHAYWAGNVWALYSALDRILVKFRLFRGIEVHASILSSTSRGLVGDTVFGVLPDITPKTCLSLTLGFIIVIMTKLYQDPTYPRFLKSIVLSAFTSFLFGWHVHEKAVLLFLVPQTLLAVEDYHQFRIWLIGSIAGINGLFPLLIHPQEAPIKVLYTITWISFIPPILKKHLHRPHLSSLSMFLMKLENIYLFGFIILQIYHLISQHEINFFNRFKVLEFLPLMLISLYTSIGLIYCYVKLFKVYLIS
ncbi:hypothetical protein O181_008070 [Austropuccinia psidii MF-1]|uniref:Alpha-1,3-glucosyltransferase n=1 Tax=Austropuccinia psidii MF-1 TaxID=1389203 RepID=A0A9Q3GIJ2_9BASI|nr:hypothetical protein [Austropuccinia psidii MF-1]